MRGMRLLAAGAALIVAGCARPSAAPQDGGQFRGGPTHPGAYPVSHGHELEGLQWRFATRGGVTASPTVAGGVVYVGGGDGLVRALDLETGALLWSFQASGPVDATAAVAGGRVFVGDRTGSYYALDASDGEVLWTVATGPAIPFPWGHESGQVYTSSPTVTDGTVLFGGLDGALRAVDATTGRVRWSRDLGARIPGSPATDGAVVVVGDAAGRVHALGLGDGAERWTFETTGAGLSSADFGFDRTTVQSSPAIRDGRVYVGARDGFLYAVDLSTGTLVWRFDHDVSWVNTSPAVADGVVYAGSSDGAFVQAVDGATGSEVWRRPDAGVVWASPTVAGDVLYYGDFGGVLHALDRRTGESLWSYRTGDAILSSPVVAGDLVVVGSRDGGVYALRTGSRPVRRAVFHDADLAAAAWAPAPDSVASWFEGAGYTRVDSRGLGDFMRSRVEDGEPSVVVFALDHLPEQVLAPEGGRPLLRAYLDAGGKVVWRGTPPLLWPKDPRTGNPGEFLDISWSRPEELLGVDHGEAIFDARAARPTEVGVRWGLDGWWTARWSVAPSAVDEVLALDDWGLAAAWQESYGGPPGTGFILAPVVSLPSLLSVAEYRPGPLR